MLFDRFQVFMSRAITKKKSKEAESSNCAPDFAKFATSYCINLDGSMLRYFIFSIPIIFLSTGFASFLAADVIYFDEKDTIWIIENGHWCIIYSFIIIWDVEIGVHNKQIREMSQAVKNGFYRYDTYTTTNKTTLEAANAQVLKLAKMFEVVLVIAVGCTLLKSSVLAQEDDPYRHFFNGYFPFEINSGFRVKVVKIFELCCATSAGSSVFFYFMTFISYAYQLEAHFQVLIQKEESLFERTEMQDSEEYRFKVKRRITECLAHHRAILEVFKRFAEFTDVSVGVSTVLSGFMLCTLGYLLTNPDLDVSVIVTFSGVVFPEICVMTLFRVHGQIITDLSVKACDTLYQLEWWEQDLQIQKDIRLWHLLTSRPLQLKSLGIRNMSHEGIKDLLQASYTYFNVLKANT